MKIKLFTEYIEQKTGIFLEPESEFKLQNAIQQRMSEAKSANEIFYLELIKRDHREFNKLINLLTVNETYFQREPRHFEILAEKIISKLLLIKPGPIRILSAGSSTGEEIYSLIMTMFDKLGTLVKTRFEFLAFDIDKNALETARQGVYNRSSFRSISPKFLKLYFKDFDKPQGKKRIISDIRSQARFIHNNIMGSVYPKELRNVDVIFYRNTSIYFKPATQKAVFKKLADLLNNPGYLFLSSTETFAHDFGILPLVEIDNNFFFSSDPDLQKTPSARKELKSNFKPVNNDLKPTLKAGESNKNFKPIAKKTETSSELFRRICNLIKNDKYHEALQLIEQSNINDDKLKNDIAVAQAKIYTDFGRHDKAREICLDVIKKDQWLLWPYLLLGCGSMRKKDSAEQFEKFKKAIYILPTCWLAHYGMLKYYIQKSDRKNALKKSKIITRLLEKDSSDWLNPVFLPRFIDRKAILSECSNFLTQN